MPSGGRTWKSTLPNLLSDKDVSRLERLLARFVKLIPQEYRNGVSNGHILIALEFREATQFSQQAQSLVNELGPVWQRDQADAYTRRHRELVDKLETLRRTVAAKAPVEEVVAQDQGDLRHSGRRFQLSRPPRAGDKTNIIEETALEARAAPQQFPRRRQGRPVAGSRKPAARRVHEFRCRDRAARAPA